jgi:hypothetical protein
MLNPKGRPTLSVSLPPRWVLPAVDITLPKLHLPHPVLPSLLHYEPTYANENFALADTSSTCSQLCYFPYTRLPHTLQHDIRFNVSLPLNASVAETKGTKKVPVTSNMPTQNPSRIAQGKLDNPIKLKFRPAQNFN